MGDDDSLPMYRWVILALTCTLAFMGNYLQYQVSALAIPLMGLLGIGTAGFSVLFLVPMLAAVFFSIPLGFIGDRFGPKRVVTVCFAIASIGALLRFLIVGSFPLQVLSMFLIGIGMAALTANFIKILGIWFRGSAGTAIGIYYAASCLGIVIAQSTTGWFGSIGSAYIAGALLVVAVTVLWVFLGRDLPVGAVAPCDSETAGAFLVAARSRGVWLLAMAAGFSLAATTAFAGFLPQALEAGRGLDTSLAGLMASLVTITGVFGCVVGPLICNRCRRMKVFLVAATAIGATVMFVSWYFTGVSLGWLALAANGFATSMVGPVLQSMPILLPEIRSRYAGTAGGIMATVSLFMAFVLPTVISGIAGSNYALNMGLESLCLLLSIVPVLFLPELGARRKVEDE